MFKLRDLPYKRDSFGDFLSDKTFDYHYDKHHQAYITNLNNLTAGGEFENAELYDIITKSSGGIFNNAAQVYNHDCDWDSISSEKIDASAELKRKIEADFGSFESFKDSFIKSATTLFGSGWCWLVLNTDSNKLEIIQTSNANTPVTNKMVPILVCDVWEHAYYIDFKNARAGYLEKFWSFINWKFVSEAYEWAEKEGINSVRFYTNSIHKK